MVTHETVTEAQSTPVEFENSGFTPKRHQMFSVSEEFANATITHHFGFSEETRSRRSHDYRDVIFFGKYQFQNVSRPLENSLRCGRFKQLELEHTKRLLTDLALLIAAFPLP